jgi:hypothetical protein
MRSVLDIEEDMPWFYTGAYLFTCPKPVAPRLSARWNPCPPHHKKSVIRVRLNDGTYANIGYRIRVLGRVCKTMGGEVCISDITSIDLVTVK